MKKFLVLAAVACVISGQAFAADGDMTCEQISAEISQLNDVQTAAGNTQMNDKVMQAGTGAAVNGAIWAGAGSSVPFLGGIANAVGAVSSANAENAKQQSEEAEKRLIKLQTIAEMKGC